MADKMTCLHTHQSLLVSQVLLAQEGVMLLSMVAGKEEAE